MNDGSEEKLGPVAPPPRAVSFTTLGVSLITCGYLVLPILTILLYFHVWMSVHEIVFLLPIMLLAAAMCTTGTAMTFRSDRAIPAALLTFFIELTVYFVLRLVLDGRKF